MSARLGHELTSLVCALSTIIITIYKLLLHTLSYKTPSTNYQSLFRTEPARLISITGLKGAALPLLFFVILIATPHSTLAANGGASSGISLPQVNTELNSGAAVSSYKIKVPPGRAGIEPDLSLVYNSQGGNGLLGVGWGIGGLTAITRCKATMGRDGDYGTINMDLSDIYCLDGQKLILVSGVYGEDGAEYRLERDPSVKVVSYGESGTEDPDAPTGPRYFKTWSKGGKTTEYGYTDDSRGGKSSGPRRSYNEEENNIYLWAANRISYKNGNGISITYGSNEGTDLGITPALITYSGRPNSRYIEFSYGFRQDGYSKYAGGEGILDSRSRLLTITTLTGSSLSSADEITVYDLDYEYSPTTGESRLTGITEDGQYTSLDWQDGIKSFASPVVWVEPGGTFEAHHARYVDLNGDGYSDMIYQGDGNEFNVYLSNGSGFVHAGEWLNRAGTFEIGQAHYSDINADGKADLIFQNDDNLLDIYISDGTGFVTGSGPFGRIGTAGELGGIYEAGHSAFGDFNGDGKADLAYQTDDNEFEIYLSDGSTFMAGSIWLDRADTFETERAKYGDFNGDGMTDLLFEADNNIFEVYLSDGTTFGPMEEWEDLAGSYAPFHASYADVNGDGLPDLIYENSSGQFELHKNLGDRFSGGGTWADRGGTFAPFHASYPDLNGDGNADLLYQNSNNDFEVYLSDGRSGFELMEIWADRAGTFNAFQAQLADVNGDGMIDLLFQNSSNQIEAHLHDGPATNLLIGLNNPIGGSVDISYVPSSQYNNTYMPFVSQTVSSITYDDGQGNLSSNTYSYGDGLYNHPYREFRGFATSTEIDPAGTKTTMVFDQGDIFARMPLVQTTTDSADNLFIKVENTYSSDTPIPGVTYTYISQNDNYTYDGTGSATQASTTFTYDTTYGNLLHTHYDGDISVTGDEKDEYTEYSNDEASWMIGLPTRSYQHNDLGIKVIESWMTYDTYGNLLTNKAWNNMGTDPIVTYTYDNYGYYDSITDALGNTTAMEYYTDRQRQGWGNYIYSLRTKSINALGHVTNVTHNNSHGNLTEQADPNNNKASYKYDNSGRIIRETSPLGTKAEYAYNSFGTVGSQHVEALITEEYGTSHEHWTETYFDGMGRTIMTLSEGSGTSVVREDTFYNARGLVSQKSLPYFDGQETPRFTTFSYDALGRTVRVDNHDGTYSIVAYNKGETTYTDANGNVKKEFKDIYGRLIKVEEYMDGNLYATTSYEYGIGKQLTKVTDEQNNVTTMIYDSLGRKIEMIDPDMGTWTYTYDLNGNLLSQTDATPETVNFTYDAINRMLTKNYPTGTDTTYQYDDTSAPFTGFNPIGRLTTVSDSTGQTRFFYSDLGETIKTEKAIGTTTYVAEATTDAIGRPVSVKYPDNTTVSYTYDNGGNLTAVTGYSTYSDFNAAGQPSTVTFSNGVTTQYGYRADNNLLNSIVTNVPGPGDVMDFSYDYDNNANIMTITDHLDGDNTQNFTYDDLNRLTEAVSTAYDTRAYVYNTIGNMTTKAGVTYTYGGATGGPHAVTTTTPGKIYTYNANGSMTADGERTIAYGYDNKPSSVAIASSVTAFEYDYSGARVKKTNGSTETIYAGELYECKDGQCVKHIFAGDKRLASQSAADTLYYHQDHLGSTSIMTNSSADIVKDIKYKPYGASYDETGTGSNYLFTGQELDTETGLYYYGARYYDAELGRFISADSIVPDPSNPQSLNRYSYALNNPINYTDPTGHFSLKNLFKTIVKAVIFTALAIVTHGAIFALLPSISTISAIALTGAIMGAVVTASNGGSLSDIARGAVIGAVMGFAAGVHIYAGYAMMMGGGVDAYSKGGMDGLIYYGASIASGYAMIKGLQWGAEAPEIGDNPNEQSAGATNSSDLVELPRKIKGAEIKYGDNDAAFHKVHKNTKDIFVKSITKTITDSTHDIKSIWVGATTNGTHGANSLHYDGLAVDISRVNGMKFGIHYGKTPLVKDFVTALQKNIGHFGARSNLGPFQNIGSSGAAVTNKALIKQHKNHIHFSVNE